MTSDETGITEAGTGLDLSLSVDETKAELALPEPEPGDELTAKAWKYADQLMSFDPSDQDARNANRDAIDTMGRDLQTRAAARSRMLQAPLGDLSRATED